MVCSKCGKITERSYNGLCQGCYKYFKSGGKVYPLPEAGKVEHDKNGKVICHICGRSYNRLGSHIRESHGITIEEYKAEFGLCSRTKTTEKSYSQTMRENAYKYDMDKQLLEAGKSTRIKKGETDKRKNSIITEREITAQVAFTQLKMENWFIVAITPIQQDHAEAAKAKFFRR